ncbi:MAG: histidinol-phosphate transaminase [Zestosphaera sp.]
MLRLHMNESPYPPSRISIEYVNRYAGSLNLYYDKALYDELMGELSKYVGVDEGLIEVFPGSSAVLTLMLTYARVAGLDLVATHPTFHVMYGLARSYGVGSQYLSLRGESFTLDVEELLRRCEGRLVYIINPNNPTGNLLLQDPDVVREVARRAKAVFVDEAYYEFSGVTFKDLAAELDNVAIIRSVSKSFCLAGARFGYAVLGRGVKRVLNSLRIGFEVPLTTQAAVLGALKDLQYVREVVRSIVETRERTRRGLEEMGLRTVESQTNFILVDLGRPCRDLWGELKGRGVLTLCLQNVEDLREFSNYVRVSVGRPEEMEFFLQTMASALEGLEK